MSDKTVTQINPTKIVMVGPSRVGKTSMLASMYNVLKKDERNQANQRYRMNIDIHSATADDILEKGELLEAIASSSGIVMDKHVPGSSEKREYNFFLNIEDQYKMPFDFIDVPGGWYTGAREGRTAQEQLADSHVSFLVVDAPALMEARGKYHKQINATARVQELYESTGFKHKHSVVLVLVRAESYFADQLTLRDTVRKEYRNFAKCLASKGVNLKACYVKTMGGVYFNNYQLADIDDIREGKISVPLASFRKDPKVGYRPEYCDVPLRIAVQQGLDIVIEETKQEILKEDGWWTTLISWIGMDWAMQRLSKQLVAYESTKRSIVEKLKGSESVVFNIPT